MYYLNISSHIKQNSFLCCSVFAAVLLHADCSTIVLTIAESRVTVSRCSHVSRCSVVTRVATVIHWSAAVRVMDERTDTGIS